MANTPQNYNALGQQPLDAKYIFTNKTAFDALVQNNPIAYAFNFYKGMIVYLQQEEKFYIWENPFSKFFEKAEKLLQTNYIYPQGSVYNGLDYSGKTYNLLEFTYNKENIGLWTIGDDDKTVIVEIYENSNVNAFNSAELLAIWPNTEKIAFVGGTLTGIKLLGQPVQLFQEFIVDDWDNITYDIWNSVDGFNQDAKIRLIESGENVDYSAYENQIIGNSFKEVRIIHDNLEIKNKSSIYFKPVGETGFEIFVVDNANQSRSLQASVDSGDDMWIFP